MTVSFFLTAANGDESTIRQLAGLAHRQGDGWRIELAPQSDTPTTIFIDGPAPLLDRLIAPVASRQAAD